MDIRLNVVLRNDSFVNLRVTRTKVDESLLYAYRGEEIVGFFDLGFVNAYWLTDLQKKERSKDADN